MSKNKPSILIVDDNEELHFALKVFLTPHFGLIESIKNPNQVLSKLEKFSYDVILLDMNFNAGVNSGNEGLYWLKRILEINPNACIVMITAYGDVELAVKSMKEGAIDFIQKSWDDQKILSTLLSAYKQSCSKIEIKDLKEKQKHLNQQLNKHHQLITGNSPSMKKVMETVRKIASTDANVLIIGENGTGKEVIAREIYKLSNRCEQVFISVDMGAIPESLFESELFGHKKGAFTDAKDDRVGRIEVADKGTLFLDEIGNLPIHLQPKLLSSLQNREITPLGSSIARSIDIRLISATNQPLKTMVEKGNFREDLLYRINTITIELPPLRERKEDIPELASYFLTKYSENYCKSNITLSSSAIKKLTTYNWPGNIRELQHTIERAIILSNSSTITENDLQLNTATQLDIDEESKFSITTNERKLIIQVLEICNGNIKLAAQKLGINRSTLYDKMRKYGI